MREQKAQRSFVQTLFNWLMFVYFLSRKGWLTFQNDKDYLNALWQDYLAQPTHGDSTHTRLQTPFFSGLNNPDSRDLTQGLATLIGDVLFLNGGLFDMGELDDLDGVTVPDSAIERVLSGLFDRFNFTVMESTPFDIEVAVDPEMLGKVFEELVTGRHDSGAYYTPRPWCPSCAERPSRATWRGRTPAPMRKPSPGSWTSATRMGFPWPPPDGSVRRSVK